MTNTQNKTVRKKDNISKEKLVALAKKHNITTSGSKKQISERIFKLKRSLLSKKDMDIISPFLSKSHKGDKTRRAKDFIDDIIKSPNVQVNHTLKGKKAFDKASPFCRLKINKYTKKDIDNSIYLQYTARNEMLVNMYIIGEGDDMFVCGENFFDRNQFSYYLPSQFHQMA